jgi:hypothetical protein
MVLPRLTVVHRPVVQNAQRVAKHAESSIRPADQSYLLSQCAGCGR